MPPLERQFRTRKAVYWEAAGVDGDNQPLVKEPVELTVRWVEDRRQGVGAQGQPIAIDVTLEVDRELVVGSVLWKGALADMPATPTGLKQVVAVSVVDDVKGRITGYGASLVAYSDRLPQYVAGTGTGT